MNTPATANRAAKKTSLPALFRVFLKIGLLSFGGPAAQIALMHRILVGELRWLTEQQYLNALSFCMLLPGPEAMQLATYSGWRLRGLAGGMLAGLLFVLPGALIIFALVTTYAVIGNVDAIATLFLGVKAAVVIIVLEALLRVSKRALKKPVYWAIAGLAFIGIFFFAIPYPIIVLLAALSGFLIGGQTSGKKVIRSETTAGQTIRVIALGLLLWLLPIALLAVFANEPILGEIGLFFSKLAVVTFGGAYAVLAYMAQDVVTNLGWLSAGEMMDGLGLAETTPGPLILVTQFVGFMAGFHQGGIALALAAACTALWATFVPCFLWIFAGAPYIEWICAQPRLGGALAAISAAVVGVILNLSIWFALHVFFAEVVQKNEGWLTLWVPTIDTLDWRVALLAALCGFLLLRLHLSIFWVLLISSGVGFGLVNGF